MSNIIDQLKPLAVPIDSIHQDPANARTGHAIDRIAASLQQYGQRKPIVVNAVENGKIEAGNGTWQAAKHLGWKEIAAVMVEDDPMTAAGYGLADNRLNELSEWDNEALATLLQGIDLDEVMTGFDSKELDAILTQFDPPTLDDLAEEYGEPQERDFWPVIRVQVSPETNELYQSFIDDLPGDDEAEKMAIILGAVDASILGSIVP